MKRMMLLAAVVTVAILLVAAPLGADGACSLADKCNVRACADANFCRSTRPAPDCPNCRPRQKRFRRTGAKGDP